MALSVIWGANGVKASNHMVEQQKILSVQVTELEKINTELTLEVNALTNDKAVIAAYARKLDYVSDGEKLVKITGLQRSQPPLYDAGTVIKHEEPKFMSENLIKFMSIVLGVLTLVLIFLWDLYQGNISFKKKEDKVVTGIPIYDLQQI